MNDTELCAAVARELGWYVEPGIGVELPSEERLFLEECMGWTFSGAVLEELARRGRFCTVQIAKPDLGGSGCTIEDETVHDTATHGGLGYSLELGPRAVIRAAAEALGVSR